MTDKTENKALEQANAQMASVREMVAALECDYDRLEELREAKAEQAWAANWSLCGCLPDNDPGFYEDESDARTALVDELNERADDDETAADDMFVGMSDQPSVALETRKELRQRAERYREAAQHLEDSSDYSVTVNGWHFWITDDVPFEDAEELAELEAQAGECNDREDAETRIDQDALEVSVRSGWQTPHDEPEWAEFKIVLCTGGPHVEIRGELEQGAPTRARLVYSDWFTGMAERVNEDDDEDALLAYASRFFAG